MFDNPSPVFPQSLEKNTHLKTREMYGMHSTAHNTRWYSLSTRWYRKRGGVPGTTPPGSRPCGSRPTSSPSQSPNCCRGPSGGTTLTPPPQKVFNYARIPIVHAVNTPYKPPPFEFKMGASHRTLNPNEICPGGSPTDRGGGRLGGHPDGAVGPVPGPGRAPPPPTAHP